MNVSIGVYDNEDVPGGFSSRVIYSARFRERYRWLTSRDLILAHDDFRARKHSLPMLLEPAPILGSLVLILWTVEWN